LNGPADAWPSPTIPPADPLDATHLGSQTVQRYLRRHGLGARHALGQNHLVDGQVLDAIVAAAAPAPGRHVLEIGPGLGILTAALLRAGAAVTAVELDARLAAHLRDRLAPALERGAADASAPAGLRLVEADILDVPDDDLPAPPYDLVANLPYHVTSPVLHRFLGGSPAPQRFVLMLQRQVAERVVAPPGGMSYLSVFVQYHARVEIARIVPASAFEPAPKVDSAVVLGITGPRILDGVSEAWLWRLVQAGFRERRKMLHNVLLRQLPAIGRSRLTSALAACGIAADRRPQTLSVEEWIALAGVLGPLEDATPDSVQPAPSAGR
jgi:16S rRNA (adenine1518-N6/adenine1519-N6)-dimethyltransferase